MPSSIKRKNLENLYLITLLSLSLVLVFADRLFLDKSLRLNADSNFLIYSSDDRTVGGKSEAKYIAAGGDIQLHCELKESNYAWPFCGIVIDLTESASGIKRGFGEDLSSYTSVLISAQYQTEENKAQRGIRIQSRNFNPAYSKKGDFDSLKYNALEFYPVRESNPAELDLSAFQSAPWWLNQFKLPINLTKAEFSNTYLFEIATGAGTPLGKYTLTIDHIEFQGRYVTTLHIYLFIAVLWFLSGAILLMVRLKYSATALLKSNLKKEALESLNELLNIQSQTLADLVITDELTGIANRAALKSFFEDKEKFSTTKKNLAVIFSDIDHFKHINDTYGHLVGDEVLIQFASLLQNNIRNSDLLARWGGEEFVILCPFTELHKAKDLAEKLRLLTEETIFTKDLKITTSFGIAHLQKNESPSELLNRADGALYDAKNNGRNRVSSV
jgi:diguanylate cyclase (GGDEF)-like protein